MGHDVTGALEKVRVPSYVIDRHGIVRWANIEGQREGLAGIGKLPSEEEFLAAAHALPE